MNRNYAYAAVFALIALLVGVCVLFVIQNAERTTQLSLNLYVFAQELKEPVQIPVLIGVSTGIGFVLGMVPTLVWGTIRARRARQLERELALSGGGDQDAWRS